MSDGEELGQQQYLFGPLERRGWLYGIRSAQFLVAGIGLVLAVVTLNVTRNMPGGVLAIAIAILALAAGFARLSGRNVDEWVRLVFRFIVDRLFGRHRWHSTYPLLGFDSEREEQPVVAPPTLQDWRLLSAPYQGSEVGVFNNRRKGTYTAILKARGAGFLGADASEQGEKVEGLGALQAALCRPDSPVIRFQWIERSVTSEGDEPAEYFVRESVVPMESSAAQAYQALIGTAEGSSEEHEVTLVLQVSAKRAGRALRRAKNMDEACWNLLRDEMENLASTLQTEGYVVEGLLRPRRAAAELRMAFDPSTRSGIVRREAAGREQLNGHFDEDQLGGVGEPSAYPLLAETSWGWYRTDGYYHTTFWVRELPRRSVGPAWLYPLLLRTGQGRAVSWVMEPQDPGKALARTSLQQVEDQASRSTKAKKGFRISRREEEMAKGAARRENELVAGHGGYRHTAFVTVSGATLEQLEERCIRVEHAATRARVELQRLNGQQDLAFVWGALPLAEGLS